MNTKRSVLALLACAALLATGCTGGGTSGQASAPSPAASGTPPSSTASASSQEGDAETTKPVEFTVMSAIWEPFDPDQMDIYNEAMARTGATIHFKWIPQANAADQIAATLASGDVPEVFGLSMLNSSTLIDQGALIDISSYYENGKLGNLTARLDDMDYLYMRHPADNGIYSLPMVQDYPPSMSWTIRKDWLDNLDLEVPKSWDDWMTVWSAFRDEDANKDGNANNEIPLSFELVPNALMQSFGMHTSGANGTAGGYACFTLTDDNVYTFVVEHPRFYDYLEMCQRLYADKIIDQEYSSRNNQELFKIMDNNTLGSAYTWAERVRLSTEVNREVIPEATWIGVEPPVAPGGKAMINSRIKVGNTLAITVAAEEQGKVDDIISFFNWVFGDEGERLFSFGIEGQHYDVVDGEPVLKPELAAGGFVEARKAGIIPTPFAFTWEDGIYQQLLMGGKTYEESPEPVQLFYDALHMHKDYFIAPLPNLDTEAYVSKQADLLPKFGEIMDSCITGRLSIDEFKTEYEKLKSAGLQDIIDQCGEAYQKMVG